MRCMKTCSACGKPKQEAEFGIRRASPDGLTSACRECLKARDRDRYHGKENAKRRAAMKAYAATGGGSDRRRAAVAAWIKRNPEKRKAQVAVSNAIRDGKLVRQPCEDCGNPKSQAHHDDYSKAMEVRWKCARCHASHHRQEREQTVR